MTFRIQTNYNLFTNKVEYLPNIYQIDKLLETDFKFYPGDFSDCVLVDVNAQVINTQGEGRRYDDDMKKLNDPEVIQAMESVFGSYKLFLFDIARKSFVYSFDTNPHYYSYDFMNYLYNYRGIEYFLVMDKKTGILYRSYHTTHIVQLLSLNNFSVNFIKDDSDKPINYELALAILESEYDLRLREELRPYFRVNPKSVQRVKPSAKVDYINFAHKLIKNASKKKEKPTKEDGVFLYLSDIIETKIPITSTKLFVENDIFVEPLTSIVEAWVEDGKLFLYGNNLVERAEEIYEVLSFSHNIELIDTKNSSISIVPVE